MRTCSVLEFGLEPAAALLNEAFADYFVRLTFTPARLLSLVREESVDLEASRVCWDGDRPAAVLLHAARGQHGRLAGMAVVASARRHGLGREAVAQWIANCRARGLRRLRLEVIGANVAARRLYEQHGFTVVERLAGWSWRESAGQASTSADTPVRVDLTAMASLVAARDPNGQLPWQISGATLATLTPPCAAWQLGEAHALVSDPAAPVIAIRGLTWSELGGPAAATRLLRALTTHQPKVHWRVPAIFPESWSPIFHDAGWQSEPIDQWLMERVPN